MVALALGERYERRPGLGRRRCGRRGRRSRPGCRNCRRDGGLPSRCGRRRLAGLRIEPLGRAHDRQADRGGGRGRTWIVVLRRCLPRKPWVRRQHVGRNTQARQDQQAASHLTHRYAPAPRRGTNSMTQYDGCRSLLRPAAFQSHRSGVRAAPSQPQTPTQPYCFHYGALAQSKDAVRAQQAELQDLWRGPAGPRETACAVPQ